MLQVWVVKIFREYILDRFSDFFGNGGHYPAGSKTAIDYKGHGCGCNLQLISNVLLGESGFPERVFSLSRGHGLAPFINWCLFCVGALDKFYFNILPNS